ncbi:MAG TPA: methyltransferase domain-containing protein [Ktedonobacteraceae bacterium]|nr:methyltransferase domain-containing protein [Ktedonobacteraceae bacterium]
MTPEPRKNEHPSTYIVSDRDSQPELIRLTLQDQLLTASMGGVLAEQPDPARLRRVLDIGCGTGGWAIETAQQYPGLLLVAGIDISQRMIIYAREQAESEQVAQHVEFRVMDALRYLEFPNGFFDLVNLRLGGSWLRTWDWPKLLTEIFRITSREGTVRITEQEVMHQRSSQAATKINEMVLNAFFRAGHLFEQTSTGLTSRIPSLMTQYGFGKVQTKGHALEYRAGTPETQMYNEDMIAASRTLRPFLKKWGCLSNDYEELCQQLVTETQAPDFYSLWNFQTIWGIKPF